MPAIVAPSISLTPDGRPVWKWHSNQKAAYDCTAAVTVAVTGRQWGKTTLGVRRMIRGAHLDRLAGRDTNRIIVEPIHELCRIPWKMMLKEAPPGWITGTCGTEKSPDWIEFGPAKVMFRTGDNPQRIVGDAIADLWLDEAGTMDADVWEESVQPMLAKHNAPALVTGTPKGKNWLYALAMRGMDDEDPEVQFFHGPSYENPFIAREFWERLAYRMPRAKYRQEILGEFIDLEGGVFDGVDWDKVIQGEVSGPIAGHIYLGGLDLARLHDYTVPAILDDTASRFVAMDRYNKRSWRMMEQRAARLFNAYGVRPYVDSTGVGDRSFEEVEKLCVAGAEPVNFSRGNNKAALIENLVYELENANITIPASMEQFIRELKAYQGVAGKAGRISYGAPSGWFDDCVVGGALACWGRRGYHPPEVESVSPGGGYGVGAQVAPTVAPSTFRP